MSGVQNSGGGACLGSRDLRMGAWTVQFCRKANATSEHGKGICAKDSKVNWFENGAWVPPHKDIVHETRVKPKGRPPVYY